MISVILIYIFLISKGTIQCEKCFRKQIPSFSQIFRQPGRPDSLRIFANLIFFLLVGLVPGY